MMGIYDALKMDYLEQMEHLYTMCYCVEQKNSKKIYQ